MTQKRELQIMKEVFRRVDEWQKNSSIEEMTAGFSFIRFQMSLGMMGYPFYKPKWMKDKKFNKFISNDEYYSLEYERITKEIFNKLLAIRTLKKCICTN